MGTCNTKYEKPLSILTLQILSHQAMIRKHSCSYYDTEIDTYMIFRQQYECALNISKDFVICGSWELDPYGYANITLFKNTKLNKYGLGLIFEKTAETDYSTVEEQFGTDLITEKELLKTWKDSAYNPYLVFENIWIDGDEPLITSTELIGANKHPPMFGNF